MAASTTINLELSGNLWIVSDSDDKEVHECIVKVIWGDVCFGFEDDAQKTLITEVFESFGYTLNFT